MLNSSLTHNSNLYVNHRGSCLNGHMLLGQLYRCRGSNFCHTLSGYPAREWKHDHIIFDNNDPFNYFLEGNVGPNDNYFQNILLEAFSNLSYFTYPFMFKDFLNRFLFRRRIEPVHEFIQFDFSKPSLKAPVRGDFQQPIKYCTYKLLQKSK